MADKKGHTTPGVHPEHLETGEERVNAIYYQQTPENLIEYYDKWCHWYDQDYEETTAYKGPEILAAMVSQMIKDKHVHILDLAAGTGLVGQALKIFGFNNVDALDGSQKMLDLAAKKEAYTKLICAFVGPEPLPIPDDTYDIVTCCGAFIVGHLNESCFPEVLRITKKGGKVMLACNAQIDHHEELANIEPTMEKLCTEGKWKHIEKSIIPGYHQNPTEDQGGHGNFYAFEKL